MSLTESRLPNWQVGSDLPTIVRYLNQQKINLYAEVVGDYNPIHIDPVFASRSTFGSTIAHGMLILAYVSEMMEQAFGINWLSGAKMGVRFKAPARATDVVTISGKVDSITEVANGVVYKCLVNCRNQNTDTIVTGEAEVTISGLQGGH